VTELDGELAPPMENGEVVFEAPWQGRAFGMARTLADAGLYAWEDFRACLIRELAHHRGGDDEPFAYYDHFLRALETLLVSRGLLDAEALGQRRQVFMARPHDHDHDHDHDHH